MSITITDKAEFKKHVGGWAEKLDVQVASITMRTMTTKWASYSTAGRLTFDTSLLELSGDLRDYIIVHELLHFHVPNHGKLWKSLMCVHLGNHEELAKELESVKIGGRLES